MIFYSLKDLADIVLEEGSSVLNEIGITQGVFPIRSSLRNKRPLFTFAHATDKCKQRTSPWLTMLLFDQPLIDWRDAVNTMISKALKPADMTKITKLLEDRGDSGEATVKLTFTRLANTPEGKQYKGEMSLVLLAGWPEINKVYAKNVSKQDFSDRSYMLADPKLDPRYKDKVEKGELTPLTKDSFKNLNFQSWVFVIIGYAGQYTLPDKREIYNKKPADIIKLIELPPMDIDQKGHDALVAYSKETSGDFSYFN